jgi:hypothetical protein
MMHPTLLKRARLPELLIQRRRPLGRRAGLLIATVISTTATSVMATLVTRAGTVRITSSQFTTDVAVNDLFHFSFTYDDSVTDSNGATTLGTFTDALTAFSFSRDAGNSGTWDPSGGTFSLPDTIFSSSLSEGAFNIAVSGSGFPMIDGVSLGELRFDFIRSHRRT